MPRRVDEVERIEFSVAGAVLHLDGVALDGDALFALELHVVEHLGLHLALVERVGLFEQAVGKGALSVVDVGYDAEVADVFHVVAEKFMQIYELFRKPKGLRARSGAIFGGLFAVQGLFAGRWCRNRCRNWCRAAGGIGAAGFAAEGRGWEAAERFAGRKRGFCRLDGIFYLCPSVKVKQVN